MSKTLTHTHKIDGQVLSRLRRVRDWTQLDLARASRLPGGGTLSQQVISYIEQGTASSVGSDTIAALATAFGVAPEQMYGWLALGKDVPGEVLVALAEQAIKEPTEPGRSRRARPSAALT